jgi:hypothetical protein
MNQKNRSKLQDLALYCKDAHRFEISTLGLHFRHRFLRSELTLNAVVAYLKSVWGLIITRTDYLPEIHFGPSKTKVYKRLKIRFTCFQHFEVDPVLKLIPNTFCDRHVVEM